MCRSIQEEILAMSQYLVALAFIMLGHNYIGIFFFGRAIISDLGALYYAILERRNQKEVRNEQV